MAEAAKKAASMAAAALGGSMGSAPGGSKGSAPERRGENGGENGEKSTSGDLGRLLGIPLFDPVAAKRAVIQGSVVTALVVLFFFGLYLFVGRSIKVK